MYILFNALKNLYRCRKRYLITAAAILFPLSIFLYSAFYYETFASYNENCAEKYLSLVELRFRDDLQYRGDRGYDNSIFSMNNVNPEDDFNYDGSMDKYDYVLVKDKEYFTRLEGLSTVEKVHLGYVTNTYADVKFLPEQEAERRPLDLYGGEIKILNNYINGMSGPRMAPEYIEIVEGCAVESGQMECLLHRDFAKLNGFTIGSTITLYDNIGGNIADLTVVGYIEFYQGYENFRHEMDMFNTGYTIGTMPYYRMHCSFFMTVFTDFDFTYNTSTRDNPENFDETHTFNNYIPMIQLKSADSYEQFLTEVESLGYEDIFAFYPLENVYEKNNEENNQEGSFKIMLVMAGLSTVIIAVTMIIQFRERRSENLLYSALGINKCKVLLSWATESLVFLTAMTLLSLILASLIDPILHSLGTFFFSRSFEFEFSAFGFAVMFSFAVILWLIFMSGSIACLYLYDRSIVQSRVRFIRIPAILKRERKFRTERKSYKPDTEKKIFILTNNLKNIIRNGKRYILFSVPIFICITFFSCAVSVLNSANAVLETHLPIYAPNGYYIAIEDVDAANALYTKEQVQEIDSAAFVSLRLAIVGAIVTVLLVNYMIRFMCNIRFYEYAVICVSGVDEKTVRSSAAAEMLIFLCGIFLPGYFTGVLLAAVLPGITPDYLPPAPPDLMTILLCIAAIFVLMGMNMIRLRRKFVKTPPIRLLSADV